VARVFRAEALSGVAERLTWAGAGSHPLVIWPAGQAQGDAPSSDSCEEMLLSVMGDFMGSDFLNRSVVNVTWGNLSFVYQALK
jgi:hypothetical protein